MKNSENDCTDSILKLGAKIRKGCMGNSISKDKL